MKMLPLRLGSRCVAVRDDRANPRNTPVSRNSRVDASGGPAGNVSGLSRVYEATNLHYRNCESLWRTFGAERGACASDYDGRISRYPLNDLAYKTYPEKCTYLFFSMIQLSFRNQVYKFILRVKCDKAYLVLICYSFITRVRLLNNKSN